MPIQVFILSASYMLMAIILFLKYSGSGLYGQLDVISFSDLIRAGLPFFLAFLAVGLFVKKKGIRQTALYWVFTQYGLAAYFAITVGMHSGDGPIDFGSWPPLFLIDLGKQNPWEMCFLVYFIAAVQHWILSHESTKKEFGMTL